MRVQHNFLFLVVLILSAIRASAAEPASQNAASASAEKKDSPWVFSILPKSMQKNPRLEMTVITEMTEEGKKLPTVSPASPAYYELHTGGPKHLGDHHGGEHSLDEKEIRPVLVRALRTNGYLPADPPAKAPSLMIIYTWGGHATLRETSDENPVLSANQIARNILERAALVGGDKFASELLRLFREADAMQSAANAAVPPGGEPVFTQSMMAFANPVARFKSLSTKNNFLVEQSAADVYYIVATAYDYQALANNRRVMLWRTRMTVAAAGVSQEQTLPTLALTAGPYFGKEMPEPQVLLRRVLPDGAVEIGAPTVIESDVPNPTPPKK